MFSQKMAKGKDAEATGETKETSPAEEKPRPGTSGTATLTNLTATRLQAAKSLKTARRAERSYRTKKHAAAARASASTAAEHYHEGFRHLWMGLKVTYKSARMAPAVAEEKVEGVRRWWGERKARAQRERRRKLEEELEKGKRVDGEEGEKTEAP